MKIKLYIIILVVCLALLTVLFLINKEGFSNYDYTKYSTIDRIKNSSDEYAYCIAGNIKCNDGSLNEIHDDYTNGKTYNFLCNDKSFAECTGNFVHNNFENNKEYLNWVTPREINLSFSDRYRGFTEPYDYMPVDISGDYINFYDSDKNILDNIHKCDMLNTQSETDDCYKKLKKPDTGILKSGPPGKTVTNEEIGQTKCIANYGTNIGDPLCCGQKGVLQYFATKYVCPASKPTCSKYECGKSYGICS
jgi:hypothetical protein